MAGVRISGLSKVYTIGGRPFTALNEIDLSLPDGSFTSIVGRSGSGKTTLLRLLCGLEEITAGSIQLTGRPDAQSPMRVGIVFQEPRLMPWLTVRDNIAFPLISKAKGRIDHEKVDKYLSILGLEAFRDAYPAQISGGMAQRVALGRTLCYDPDLILMDEPFGALDYFTRKLLQKEIVELFSSQEKTIIFVTHDVEEAVFLSQRVAVLDQGKLSGDFLVDLPYPRQTISPIFLSLREKIYAAIIGTSPQPACSDLDIAAAGI